MRPRDSSLSTIPVTLEASHQSDSARLLIGTGRSGSIMRSAWACIGVRSNSVHSATHQALVAKKKSTKVGQNPSALSAVLSRSSFTATILSKILKVDKFNFHRVRLWPGSNDTHNKNRRSIGSRRTRGRRLQEATRYGGRPQGVRRRGRARRGVAGRGA